MEGLEKKGGAAGNVGGGERVEKEEIGNPGEEFAGKAESASGHGDEVDFTRKGEIYIEEEKRGREKEEPREGEEKEGRKEAAEGGDDGEGEHTGANRCA